MSALLGRIPSVVGYQPKLATDLSALHERITTTKKLYYFGAGNICSSYRSRLCYYMFTS